MPLLFRKGHFFLINMMCGRSNITDLRDKNNSKVQQLIKSFNEKFESTQCYELTGCDLGTEEGQTKYNENRCNELCDKFVFETIELTLDLIDD